MFKFFDMMGNYEERKVDRYETEDLIVDTCAVNDSAEPYETAIEHPAYNNGKWVVVEMYDSKEEAQRGHDKWVKLMTAKELPTELKDVSTAEIANLCDALGDDDWRTRVKD